MPSELLIPIDMLCDSSDETIPTATSASVTYRKSLLDDSTEIVRMHGNSTHACTSGNNKG